MDTPDWLGLVTFLVVALTLAFNLGMKVLALGVIPGNRKPSTGMAWLLIVMLSPLVGFIAFVFFGRAKLERSRHARQQEVNDRMLARTAEIPDLPLDPDLPPYVASVVRLNRVLSSIPLMVGNDVELEPDYEGSILHMDPPQHGEWRILVSPDHRTPLRTRAHAYGAVPFVVAGTGVASRGQESYDESVAERSELSFDPGHGVMK